MLNELQVANELNSILQEFKGIRSDRVKYPFFLSEDGERECRDRVIRAKNRLKKLIKAKVVFAK